MTDERFGGDDNEAARLSALRAMTAREVDRFPERSDTPTPAQGPLSSVLSVLLRPLLIVFWIALFAVVAIALALDISFKSALLVAGFMAIVILVIAAVSRDI
ncbi:MAG: hypothetical protein AAFR47_10750 [Pseudomonadota bacterium]